MSTLLPCPFCGTVPKLEVSGVTPWGCGNWHDYAKTIIRCNHCSLNPMAYGRSDWRGRSLDGKEVKQWRTKEEASDLATADAIRIWSKRTAAPPAAEREPQAAPVERKPMVTRASAEHALAQIARSTTDHEWACAMLKEAP